MVFLERLESLDPFSADLLEYMNDVYEFNGTSSAEIRLRWYNLSLQPGSGGKFAPDACEWYVLHSFDASPS